ncbi:MAG: hypothetical protein WBR26_09170 [Candidatus Acidiferrum sp.]
MPKTEEQWLLFTSIGGQFTPLSKPLKKKDQADSVQLKNPEHKRKAIGIRVIRIQG